MRSSRRGRPRWRVERATAWLREGSTPSGFGSPRCSPVGERAHFDRAATQTSSHGDSVNVLDSTHRLSGDQPPQVVAIAERIA